MLTLRGRDAGEGLLVRGEWEGDYGEAAVEARKQLAPCGCPIVRLFCRGCVPILRSHTSAHASTRKYNTRPWSTQDVGLSFPSCLVWLW